MTQYRVPQAARDFVWRKKMEWLDSLPPIMKTKVAKAWGSKKLRSDFMRQGVDWAWEDPKDTMHPWSYHLPIQGRKADFRPRLKAERIAEAMASMPDQITQYRQDRRDRHLAIKNEKTLGQQRTKLVEAATKRLTDMRSLVDEFDNLDDIWFDGDKNYYQLAYNDSKNNKNNNRDTNKNNKESETEIDSQSVVENTGDSENMAITAKTDTANDIDDVDVDVENVDGSEINVLHKNTRLSRLERKRRRKAVKLRQAISSKGLLSSDLDSKEEKEYKERIASAKTDPKDGTPFDGRTWNTERSMDEIAYLQQLANEPDLEKEQAKADKRKVK